MYTPPAYTYSVSLEYALRALFHCVILLFLLTVSRIYYIRLCVAAFFSSTTFHLIVEQSYGFDGIKY